MSEKKTTENLSVKERFNEALTRFGISQNRAAKEMGYTSSVLSQYANGTYKGDVSKVEEAVLKWMAKKAEMAERKYVPVIETSVLKQMTRAIRLAHDEKDIALIVSDAGSGKTTAAKKYASDNARNTVLIKCSGAMDKRAMTFEIARSLGLETYRIGLHNVINDVIDALKDREMAVIIDEADGLKSDALEFSRRLVNDLGEAALVLIGLPKLVRDIQNLKNDHRQLESRIGVFLKLEGLTKSDAEKIAGSVWPDVSKDIIDAVYDISRKDVRQFVKIINRAQNMMFANKLDEPDLEIIEMAGNMILRRSYGKAS